MMVLLRLDIFSFIQGLIAWYFKFLHRVRQASSVVASERCTALYAAVRRGGARQFYHGEAAKRVSSASLFLATVDVSVKLKEAP